MQSVNSESESSEILEYQVAKVEKIDTPNGANGDNWYVYVIKRRNNTNIVGHRRGTLEQVKEHVQKYVENINSRDGNGGYSMWMTRKKNKQLNSH